MVKVSEVLDALDPQEKTRLQQELAEVIDGELNQMAEEDPQRFLYLMEKMQKLVQRIKSKEKISQNSVQSNEENQEGDAPSPEQENPE